MELKEEGRKGMVKGRVTTVSNKQGKSCHFFFYFIPLFFVDIIKQLLSDL